MAITATYVSPSGFTVETDRTIEFCTGRRVKADCGVDGDKYGTITSSVSGAGDLTTVNLTETSDNLTANLTEVYYGLQSEGSSGSVPIHNHDNTEGSGGSIDASDHDIADHGDTSATGSELDELTGGGDTTLHDHDGISENTSARHTQGTDVALGVVAAKNPPIDADKAIYRDSTSSDALVTSTWTQVKAFLKTYFDTIYNKYVHPNHSGDVTSVADGATTIVDKKVTLAKMNDMATASILGRNTAGVGVPEVLSKATALSLLNIADGAEVNVATNLALGAGNATTEVITSSTGTDVTLIEADTDNAGLLGADKWDEIVANTLAKHTRSHTMVSTSDHTAGNWKMFASNGSGEITEITNGAADKVLTGNGVTAAPTWESAGAAAGGEWDTHQTFEDSTLTTLTSGASASWDLEANQITTLTINGSGTLLNPTNKSATGHGIYTLIVINSGAYTLTFDSEYLFADGDTPEITESGTDVITFICNGTNMYGAISQNFS